MKYKRLTLTEKDEHIIDCLNCPKYETECEPKDCIDIAINRLSELEDKIENGTLVELPCKVGDTLYRFYATECVIPVKVERITIASIAILVETTYGNFLLQEVGRDIFLTKAEAEKRLQELRGEK